MSLITKTYVHQHLSGLEIALACDLRIVDTNARAGFVQIKNGLTPGWGAGQRLLRLVGYSRAMDLLLAGHIMKATDMLALGLVNRITLPEMMHREVNMLAQSIAKQPPIVVRGIKALLQAGLTQPYETALQTERAIFPPLWAADSRSPCRLNCPREPKAPSLPLSCSAHPPPRTQQSPPNEPDPQERHCLRGR